MGHKTLTRLELRVARALNEIVHEMKDPRLPIVVTIERVRLSPDLSQARVLVSAIERPEETVEILNRAHHYLQDELAHALELRRLPRLRFFADRGEVVGW
ncbi:30S ribosome-binding factor RbfA [Oceanithermus sp.]|uniref:30S ribosome-binding factor RbfA n=1 Tax=Oceanithermus sp. TaxID=2268145 RepID=UPI0025E75892|nr:30S ribosome-binding factor RbfA [Oceanithermus sp.]